MRAAGRAGIGEQCGDAGGGVSNLGEGDGHVITSQGDFGWPHIGGR
jgi:hypothetical protein